MTRVLFVVPPLAGHTVPTVPIARALAAAGHEVAWAAHAEVSRPLLPADARVFPLGDAPPDFFKPQQERSQAVRGLESLRFLWETLLVPLARATRPLVARVIDDYRPDVICADQQAIGGALAARASARPWATLCTTSAGVTAPLAGLPKVQAWVDAQLAGLVAVAGLSTTAEPDLSPARVIVLSTDALVGPVEQFPAHYRFVGPAIGERPDATPFPFEQLATDRPRVLVSLGTVSLDRGGDFYHTCAAALGDGPWQVVLVAPDGRLPSPPANFIVRPRVPQLALLPRLSAVVSHGGHNTVCETLAHGLPLVVTPIRDDQPVIAEQVAKAGCGLRLSFGRLTPVALREAVARVLTEPTFAAAAARVRESFARAGGAAAAARHLTELAA